MKLPKIWVTRPVMASLKKAFNTSAECIYLALRFHRNSDQARAIRAKAIALKEEEIKKEKTYEPIKE